MELISIVVPCYNEEESLPLFYEKVIHVLEEIKNIDYELLFVDDGSKDCTLPILKKFSLQDKKVRFVSFSRNFGKEAAMYAGLREAKGDYVAILDADLQHPPELLQEMYRVLKNEDVDCACALRSDRDGEKKLRTFLTKQFYKIIDKLSETRMINGAGDYRMMSRKMVDSILLFKEYNRYSKGLFSFVGFETKWLPFHNIPRVAGTSKWSFQSLVKYAFDGVISFSTTPLKLASYVGIFFCVIAFVMAFYTAVKTIIFGNPTSGWTTLVCIILFTGGLQMLFLGIIGQYISKIYMEIKQRPIYIIKEANFSPKSQD